MQPFQVVYVCQCRVQVVVSLACEPSRRPRPTTRSCHRAHTSALGSRQRPRGLRARAARARGRRARRPATTKPQALVLQYRTYRSDLPTRPTEKIEMPVKGSTRFQLSPKHGRLTADAGSGRAPALAEQSPALTRPTDPRQESGRAHEGAAGWCPHGLRLRAQLEGEAAEVPAVVQCRGRAVPAVPHNDGRGRWRHRDRP